MAPPDGAPIPQRRSGGKNDNGPLRGLRETIRLRRLLKHVARKWEPVSG
jgi:hypothetical protein